MSAGPVREDISVGGPRPAVAVRAPCDVSGAVALDALDLAPSKGVLVVVGSTAALAPEVARRIRSLLEHGVASLAATRGLTVLTGATDAGIFAVLGAAMSRAEAALVGVAPVHLVTWPDRTDEGPDPFSLTPLEPHHSHFVLVDGHTWGDETAALVELAQALASRVAVAAVLFGGGPVARCEVVSLVAARITVVAIAGSGRLANALARAAEDHDGCADRELAALAEHERLVVFPPTGGPSELVTTLEELLA